MTHRYKTVVPIYDWASLTLIITDQLKQSCAMRNCSYSGERGHYLREGTTCVVAMERKTITAGVVAHESDHMARDILAESGVITTHKNDEAKAYLTDWLARWITNRVKKAGVKIANVKPRGNRLK